MKKVDVFTDRLYDQGWEKVEVEPVSGSKGLRVTAVCSSAAFLDVGEVVGHLEAPVASYKVVVGFDGRGRVASFEAVRGVLSPLHGYREYELAVELVRALREHVLGLIR